MSIKPDHLHKKRMVKKKIIERHRHRYEVNNTLISQLEQAGLKFQDVRQRKFG